MVPLLCRSDPSCEAVTRAAYRLDNPRVRRIGLDLFPQPGNLIVDAAIEGAQVVALEQVHDLLARQDVVGSGDEQRQQIELARRQRAQRTIGSGELATLQVKHPPVEVQRRLLGLKRG